MAFNEDSRVKIPAILHLCRMGYVYRNLKSVDWDSEYNFALDSFIASLKRINPTISQDEIERLLQDIRFALENEDLGRKFYELLTARAGVKLLDFDNVQNNSFEVVTELTYKNGDEEFRPDITLLINGLPLAFVEVKKPNNKEGILAEHKRIETRFKNQKFRHFVNLTQIMVFSNNMEYDETSPLPTQGAFYATASYSSPQFNYFREERPSDLAASLGENSDELENQILKDSNLQVIKHNSEFLTNKAPYTPTNRILSSLFTPERLMFLLRYAVAFVEEPRGLQKHIMRYPQIFATMAIREKLEQGEKKGIIWHTQGSGKTALAYYNVHYLSDYFQTRDIIPKFYFVVDRIDLLEQAKSEFASRGLKVRAIESRDAFAKDIKQSGAILNESGVPEITVVNIQKFQDDPDVARYVDYHLSTQRIYFLDEVHRSYNPKGSFLANLEDSDKNAIKIGLTGTPLLGDDFNSRSLFGGYIHKYYYNASIADGYTLRLIREEIASNYKLVLSQALDEIEVQQGDVEKQNIYANARFVEPMLDYIIEDFENSRVALGDSSIGGMVICDSSEQAKELFKQFQIKYANREICSEQQVRNAALILHDIDTKTDRKDNVNDFKAGKIDFLFVYNMLLTGFDAKRLKKLYLGRVIKKHNLLQALTRVNRTYKDLRYGYVVDFADIRKEFDATNKAYFDELQDELGDEMEHYSKLFKSKEEIEQEIEEIKNVLFEFELENAEIFQQQISEISDRAKVLSIQKALDDAKTLYNLIRLYQHYEILDQLDFRKLGILYREVTNHLSNLNLKARIENSADISNLINVALEDVIFMFTKVKEEELVIADQLKSTLRQTREALASNFDQKDPQFISLREELERLFKKKNLSEVSQEEMLKNIDALNSIHAKIKELNRQNNNLRIKYGNDAKYARVHKRIREQKSISESERKIFEALNGVKKSADDQVLNNTQILDNESFFDRLMMPLVIDEFKTKHNFKLDPNSSKYINGLIVKEYINEFHHGSIQW